MKLKLNFLRGGGAKQKTFCEGSMDIFFWNCTMSFINNALFNLVSFTLFRTIGIFSYHDFIQWLLAELTNLVR